MTTDDGANDAHEPAPATVDAILADLRAAEIAVSVDPTHDLTTAAVGDLDLRASLPNCDVSVTDLEELDLEPSASAWVTPTYNDRGGDVSLSLTAEDDDHTNRVSTCAELEPDEARDLALQLLASAAAVEP